MTGLGTWWEGSYHQNPPNKTSPRVFFRRSHPLTGYQVHIHIEERLPTYCNKESKIYIAEQLMFLNKEFQIPKHYRAADVPPPCRGASRRPVGPGGAFEEDPSVERSQLLGRHKVGEGEGDVGVGGTGRRDEARASR